jgi:hypothetical protein
MSAIDLDAGRLFAQIVSTEVTTFKPGDPPVLVLTLRHNSPAPSQVRCNQTNRSILATAFGWDTDAWRDQKIELWVEPTSMGPGIRMRPVGPTAATAPDSNHPPPSPSKPRPPQKSRIEDDEVPF